MRNSNSLRGFHSELNSLTSLLRLYHETSMTRESLISELQARRADTRKSGGTAPGIPDDGLVGLHTRCRRCGKALFMDDALIVEQSATVEKFLERCSKRLFEHRCDSDSRPHL